MVIYLQVKYGTSTSALTINRRFISRNDLYINGSKII
jgi:hypothetical protein